LRLNSKVTFDDGWKLAILAQFLWRRYQTVTFDPWVRIRCLASAMLFFKAYSCTRSMCAGLWRRRSACRAISERRYWQREMANYAGVWCALFNPRMGTDSYFVSKAVRYAMSFAGDPSARRISEPQIAPTLNIDLPGRWFLTLLSKLRYPHQFWRSEAGQTDGFFSHLIPWPA